MASKPVTALGEHELVTAFLRDRHEPAFRELYRRHTPRVYVLARRLLGGSESDVADVVQETWIRAASRLGTFEWRSGFSTWLLGIAINCSREYIRQRARRKELQPPGATEDDDAPPTRSSSHLIDLERAIAHLPDGYREILVLHDIEGFTHEEIGQRLGIEEGTSKSQLHRARQNVRAWLEAKRETCHGQTT